MNDAIAFDQKSKPAMMGQSTMDQINNLLDLVEVIESMAEDGILNKGNANALIVKIRNAIKSLEKGNAKAAANQLRALYNQIESFVFVGKLTEGQAEYLRSIAENGIPENTFIDPRDGEPYKTVLIGDQLWMAENLRATKYNDGTDITFMPGGEAWVHPDGEGFYCWYDNDEDAHKYPYGALYNWHVVETGKLAPVGWHVPTREDYEILIAYLDGEDVAGGKLKEEGFEHWFEPNTGATNEFGFTALPHGTMNTDVGPSLEEAEFSSMGEYGSLWTSTLEGLLGFYLTISYDNERTSFTRYDNSLGYAVRCIKD